MSQCDQILNHMKTRPITAVDAFQDYGCFRLAARINDLRMKGHLIETEIIEKDQKRYAKYRLARSK